MQDQITRAFRQINERMLDRQINFILDRKAALAEFRKSPECKSLLTQKFGHAAVAEKEIQICGGKANAALARESDSRIREICRLAVNQTIARRDALIISALRKEGIEEIPDFIMSEAPDGFEGVFNIAGNRILIRTILAGGYNIQCLHQRTLVSVLDLAQ
jgi:hypothetical protein